MPSISSAVQTVHERIMITSAKVHPLLGSARITIAGLTEPHWGWLQMFSTRTKHHCIYSWVGNKL